jgi:ketopantoate hydroxymethyltransferase
MLGVNNFKLKHNVRNEVFRKRGIQAIKTYVDDVCHGLFPQAAHVRHLPKAEAERFSKQIEMVEK